MEGLERVLKDSRINTIDDIKLVDFDYDEFDSQAKWVRELYHFIKPTINYF